jgi:hypothetical protein
MRKSDRKWDWLLFGLICMSPMGAIAYYNARADEEQHAHPAPARAPHHAVISETTPSPAVVRLAVL